jgi:predicted aconitase with swiveling domain
LKQSTAVTVHIGPIVDKDDGLTPETGLTTGGVDEIVLYKDEGTSAVDISGSTTLTHRAGGIYTVTLSSSDTGTLGHLRLYIRDDDVCLPAWRDFVVRPANVYDSLVDGSDYLEVDSEQLSGSSANASLLSTFAGNMPLGMIDTGTIRDGAFTAPKFAANSLNGKGDWSTHSAADVWSGLTDAALEKMADAIAGKRVQWAISSTGDDSNSGLTRADAVATLGQAASNANNGDVILAIGTFNETLDGVATHDKALTIQGFGWDRTIITYSAGAVATVKAGHRWALRDLKVYSDASMAIDCEDIDHIRLTGVWADGAIDGIYIKNSRDVYVGYCRADSSWDPIACHGASEFLIEHTTCSTDATYDSGAIEARGILVHASTSGTIRYCNVSATRSDAEDDYATIGISIGGDLLIHDCFVHASQSGAGDGDVFAVGETSAASSGRTIVRGGRLRSSGNGNVYDLHAISAEVELTAVDVDHDHSKTSGAIRYASRRELVDDDTRIDVSTLNTLSGHDPGSQLAAQSDVTGLNDPTAAAIRAEIDSNSTQLAAIVEDTGTTIPNTLGSPAGASLAADIAENQTDLDAIITDLADGTVVVGAVQSAAVEDIFSTHTIAEAYTTDGSDGTPAQVLYDVLQALTEFAISDTTITVKQRDGSTPAHTYTMNDANNPTSRTRAT